MQSFLLQGSYFVHTFQDPIYALLTSFSFIYPINRFLHYTSVFQLSFPYLS